MPAQEVVDALSSAHLHADLKGKSVRGGALTLASQGTQFVIQSISTIVLARLLTPADFGLVAMVSAITGLASAFSDFGLSEATIQRKEITHDQVSALFWINSTIGLGLSLVTAALGPVLARFYREPRLLNLTFWMSLIFLIGGLRVQADALLKRQMRFSVLAARDIASWVLAVAVAIAMAKHGFGYWALVALPLAASISQMILSWLMVNWRPSVPRHFTDVGSMMAFGGNVAASYFLINSTRSVDNVLIGWRWGAGLLGLYSRAYNLLMLPVRQLSAPISSVAVPTFSRLQDDPERFARYYLRTANLIFWISAPMFGFLFVTAHPVIVLTLGRQWEEAAPVFQILVLSALGQLLLESIIWLFVSRGQTGRFLRLLLAISPIIVASFVVGLPFGIKGVALSGSLVLLGILPWMLQASFRGTRLTLRRLGGALMCPLAVCLVGVLVAEQALHLFGPQRILSQLLVAGAGFVVAYLISAIIRPVRVEMASVKNLVNELRLSRQAAAVTS